MPPASGRLSVKRPRNAPSETERHTYQHRLKCLYTRRSLLRPFAESMLSVDEMAVRLWPGRRPLQPFSGRPVIGGRRHPGTAFGTSPNRSTAAGRSQTVRHQAPSRADDGPNVVSDGASAVQGPSAAGSGGRSAAGEPQRPLSQPIARERAITRTRARIRALPRPHPARVNLTWANQPRSGPQSAAVGGNQP